MSYQVFTYGSLMCADIMSAVCGYPLSGQPADINGYRRLSVKAELYPGMIPDPGCAVVGVLYDGVTMSALARLDAFEGDYYRRECLVVTDRQGERSGAYAYVFRRRFYHLLSDREWCFDTFQKNGKARFQRLFGDDYPMG